MESVQFTPDQRQEILEGGRAGLDVSIYAKPEFLAIQMRQIRLGLLDNLPVEIYATTDYDWFQMEEIRKGLEAGLDIRKFADPAIPFENMRQIRHGLQEGLDLSNLKKLPPGVLKELRLASKERIDITPYIKAGYVQEQLEQIRIAKENGVDIDKYLNLNQRGPAIREIVLGLEEGLDVSLYLKEHMTWQQMRELRKGLEHRLDVSVYHNPMYSWQQMREIRKGLEDGLPVEEYSSFMYSSGEMKKRRLALLEKATAAPEMEEEEQYQNFALLVSSDMMEADIVFSDEYVKVSKNKILAALRENGIVAGIDFDAVDRIATEEKHFDMMNVARGKEPSVGKDGWYEFYFQTDIKKKPTLLENGTVDYQNIKWFEDVKRGQEIAYYHDAEAGEPGVRINGEEIPGLKGEELPPLQGRGIYLLRDKRTYVASMDGKVEYKDDKLEVINMLTLEEVTNATGNVDFNGSVYVQGSVTEGVTIRATKDVLVDGFVESAVIEAGGDIILRNGNNAGGRGYIRADGDIMGNFFENAKVYAGGDVKANYCLNSEVVAENITISGKISTIAGGIIHAGVSITSHDIGNPAGVFTKINIGKEEELSRKRTQIAQKQESVKKELTLLQNAYRDFQKKFSPEVRNTNPMYLKIEDAIYTKELEQKKLVQDEEELKQELEKSRDVQMLVKGMLHQGTQININGARWNASDVMNVTLRKIDNRVGVFRNI